MSSTAVSAAETSRLSHSFAWMLVGWTTYGACQWALLVILAKLCSPDAVGVFGLALAITAPVMIFFGLQLRLIQATDADGEYTFREYLAVRVLTTVAGFAVVLLVSLFSGCTQRSLAVIAFVGLAKGVESISDIVYGLLQKHERMKQVSISLVAKGVTSVIAMGALVAATRDVVWGAVGLASAWALVLVAYDAPRACRVLQAEPDRNPGSTFLCAGVRLGKLCRLIRLALPLGVEATLSSLAMNIPRYSIHRHLGEAGLGYYSAISYLMIVIGRITLALNEAASPRLGRYHRGNAKAYARLVVTLVLIAALSGGAGVAIAVLFGPQILTFLYRADYADHSDAFVWLMVATAIGCIADVLRYSMTAARLLRTQLALMLLHVSVVTVGCGLLVPAKGLVGAAYALCIATIARAGTGAIASWYASDTQVVTEKVR